VSAARRARPQTEHRTIVTPDGTRIAYTWWHSPSPELVLLAPGFWRVRLAKENLFLAEHFIRLGYDVASIDFRGHGDSGGAYTFGPAERDDFLSVVEDLVGQEKPYSRFAVLGFSMGGSIAADTLARRPDLPCRALAMVCSPEHVGSLRPRPWKAEAAKQIRLRHVVHVPRISGRTLLAPKPRISRALATLTIPKLIVTAEGDWLVDPSHGRTLAQGAAPPVEHVHLELGGGLHADALVRWAPLALLRPLDRWFARNAPP
jgi:pimeloyl-ACP methyl ester carboxylesterase